MVGAAHKPKPEPDLPLSDEEREQLEALERERDEQLRQRGPTRGVPHSEVTRMLAERQRRGS